MKYIGTIQQPLTVESSQLIGIFYKLFMFWIEEALLNQLEHHVKGVNFLLRR